MLPADLELAEPVDPGQDTHPVIAVFGDHSRCTALVAGRALASAPDYRELIVAVPYVRRRGSQWLHLHIPSAHSTAAMTVWNGTVHYGFTKQWSELCWQNDLFVVTTAGGFLACHAAVAARRADAVAALPAGFQHLRAALELPTIGKGSGAGLVSAYFDWSVEPAAVAPAQGYLALEQPIGALARCELQAARDGAFVIDDLCWRLSWPQASRC